MKLRRLALLPLLAASVVLPAALRAQSYLEPESSLPPHQSTLVFGQKIVYYDTGTGPTLVLVHGFA